MKVITKSTSGPDEKKGEEELEQARQQLKIFRDLLMKCWNLEIRRRLQKGGSLEAPEFQEIRRFCNQTTRDSKYLVIGRLPDDIVQTIREAINRKKEVKA